MSKRKTLSWAAAVSWMALIFFLSSQPATDSSELSSGIVEVILTAAEKVMPEVKEHIDTLHHIVRKNAHFTIYLVLGILMINALKQSFVSTCKSTIYALSISAAFASSDELHQFFVPGRGPAMTDVLIDSAGAAVGIAIFLTIRKKII
ncbi:VanZ family protein [Planomicrobium sp. CPCC 101110]|uniref:VanZ family protein n=1 Tax=Planomicrobium sp. CPCC 101110 TaxID=2599619 RepID=UPI002102E2F5|nr:VanZ family protein [Planomicrobium sp. CPCC 101110]